MEIKELIDLLPKDYEKECYEKKAIRRKRTIKNPLDLLVLLLYYLYDDHSLVDVSQFAILKNIGNISDTALIKRFIQCKDWIKGCCQRCCQMKLFIIKNQKILSHIG